MLFDDTATVIIIAHRLSTVKNCDRILVLEEGRVAEQGSFSELLATEGSRFARSACCRTPYDLEDCGPAPSCGADDNRVTILPSMACVPLRLFLLPILFTLSLSSACDSLDTRPPVATAELSLDRSRVPLGGPLEMTYRFTAAPEISTVTEPYRVFVHFLDTDGEILFTDDHDPPVATTDWRPGDIVTYERRMVIPMYPYVGDASIVLGLYSPGTSDRLSLAGDQISRNAYLVSTIELAPQRESSFLMFQDGWHPPEVDGGRQWQWTAAEATLAFRNPRQDSTFYVELDGRPDLFESPQRVDLTIGERTIDSFLLETSGETFHIVTVSADDFGDDDTTELTFHVDQTFIPDELPGSNGEDSRQLGVRVFYAFLETR